MPFNEWTFDWFGEIDGRYEPLRQSLSAIDDQIADREVKQFPLFLDYSLKLRPDE
jgi:hypothetical protein